MRLTLALQGGLAGEALNGRLTPTTHTKTLTVTENRIPSTRRKSKERPKAMQHFRRTSRLAIQAERSGARIRWTDWFAAVLLQDLDRLPPKLVVRRQSSMFFFELGNDALHVFIIAAQREVERLFSVLVVNEPESAVLAFGIFVAVHLPVQDEWTAPLKCRTANVTSVKILFLRCLRPFQRIPVLPDKDTFPLDAHFGRQF